MSEPGDPRHLHELSERDLLIRAVTELEGVNKRLDSHHDTMADHGKRISVMENWRMFLTGAWAAVVAYLGLSSWRH